MANPRQEIHSWLMQQQMPNGLGFQPGARPQGFTGTASRVPGALGGVDRFGAPATQSRYDQFTRPPTRESMDRDRPGQALPPMRRTWQPQYTVGVSEAELPVKESPADRFNSRYHADQHLNGAPVSLDPEANISEALHYAQNENQMAPIRYADNIGQQIRKFPVKQSLRDNLASSVYHVFGPGYSVEIGSGGQPRAGTRLEALNMTRDLNWKPEDELRDPTDTEFKGRIGKTNHDLGNAADIRIIGPDGLPLPEHKQGEFIQYWHAKNHGRTGSGLARDGIHVDERSGGLRHYEYTNGKPDLSRTVMKKWADRGRAGELPDLYQSPGMPEPSMSAAELGLEDPMVESRTARTHGTFDAADPQAMANEAYGISKLLPDDPYREPVVPKSKPRPGR